MAQQNHAKSIFLVAMEDSWLISCIVGNMHINEDCEPFCIGRVFNEPQEFIHVFDDVSYVNVLHELDTIQDFLRYLEARPETVCDEAHNC